MSTLARTAFTKEDQAHMVDWLVKNHPSQTNLRGNQVWKGLMDDPKAANWNQRHTWQSWRDKYVKNEVHYDQLLAKKLKALETKTRDMAALAKHFRENGILQAQRESAIIYSKLLSWADPPRWVTSKNEIEWQQFYKENKEAIDSMVDTLPDSDEEGVPVSAVASGKRRRAETEEPQLVKSKKRRIEVAEGSRATQSGKASNSTVVYARDTPDTSSRASTPYDARESGSDGVVANGNKSSSSEESKKRREEEREKRQVVLLAASTVGQGILSLPPDAKDYYEMPSPDPSPSQKSTGNASREPTPRNSQINGPSKADGKLSSTNLFPSSLPSLIPALRDKVVKAHETAPERPGEQVYQTSQGTSKLTQAASIFSQVEGQETPHLSTAAGNSRQNIFPHTLPTLTPALRPGPQGEKEYIIDEDVVTYAERTPEGKKKSRKRAKSKDGPEEGSDESDAFFDEEGPSPMPNLGSDRHSSRSFSFSHGGPPDDLAYSMSLDPLPGSGTRMPQQTGLFRRGKQPVDESPFSDDDEEDEGTVGRSRKAKANLVDHRPVLAKRTVAGYTRFRAPARKNALALSSDSEVQEENEQSDKENKIPSAKKVEEEPEQPQPMDETPDPQVFSPQSLHMSGKTPPSANVTATSIKPAARPASQSNGPFRTTLKSQDAKSSPAKKDLIFPTTIRDASHDLLAKAALSYPSPTIPSEEEERRRRGEEPSPLQRFSQRVTVDAPETSETKHAKVRFDGAAIDKSRRKTTGGIGTSFADGGIVSTATAGPSRSQGNFKANANLFSAGSKPPAATTKKVELIDLDDDEEAEEDDDESPLARYSAPARGAAAAASSPLKKVVRVDRDVDREKRRKSSAYPIPSTRVNNTTTTADRVPHSRLFGLGQQPFTHSETGSRSGVEAGMGFLRPPPPAIPVPILPSSPLPGSSPPRPGSDEGGESPDVPLSRQVRQTGRSGAAASATRSGTNKGFGIAAEWSPIRFGSNTQSGGITASQRSNNQYDNSLNVGDRGRSALAELARPAVALRRSGLPLPSSSSPRAGIETDEGGEAVSIGFRDQVVDAEWVDEVPGRPAVKSRRISSRRRSAPIERDGDEVIYVSSSPARPEETRASRRASSAAASTTAAAAGEEEEVPEVSMAISEHDQAHILNWIEARRDQDSDSDEEEEEDDDGSLLLLSGLSRIFTHLSRESGFDEKVPRNVWEECGDLEETASIVHGMKDAAELRGREMLREMQAKKLEEGIRMRSGILEAENRRRSTMAGGGGGASRRSSVAAVGQRRSSVSRSRPPRSVPAEVVGSLFSPDA